MRSSIEGILTGKTSKIYKAVLGNLAYNEPHQFLDAGYSKYKSNYKDNPSINGRIFDL